MAAAASGRRRAGLGLIALLAAASPILPGLTANGERQPLAAAPEPAAAAADAGEPATTMEELSRDPFAAYRTGRYDWALAGFVDRQVERPDDPAVMINLGSSHYQLGDYAAAEKAFTAALATASEPDLETQALYSLGNTAFRQGRLPEAIELYRRTLEIDPDDQDAKHNLELARRELERRQQEARQRQQQQQPSEDQQQQSQDQQQQQQEQQQDQQQPQEGEQDPTPGEQDRSGQGDETESDDRDGDGLPDETERQGENPTDPANPDTDGDGLADGAEDADRDGRVDPGETDPNKVDSDGDGVPDGADASPPAAGEAAASETAGAPSGLTREQAERYLQAIQEGEPQLRRKAPTGRRSRRAKDW